MNKKIIPWKSVLIESIAITVLTLALSYFCAPILQFFSPQRYFQQSSDDNEFTSSFFQNVYATMNEGEVDSSNVVIVDVGYLTKRDDIAKLLLQIDSMHPKRMGVDILFSDYYNTREDSILWRAVNAIKNNTVFVCAVDNNNKIVHSFFCNPDNTDLYVDGISEGLSELLLDKDKKTINYFRYKDVIEKDTFLTFAAGVTEDYYNVSDVDDSDHIIDYKKIGVDVIKYDSLREDKIRGRLVLVGTMVDGQDQHGSPIGVLSGLEVHAQIADMINQGDSIEEAGWIPEFLFSMIPLFFFVFVLVLFDYWGDYYKSKENEVWATLFLEIGCLPFGLSVLFIMVLGTVLYMTFTNCGILVRMSSALIGVTLLAIFSKSVVRFLKTIYLNNKKQKQK